MNQTYKHRTGDVVLFRYAFKWYNPATWLSFIIRLFTAAKYNHVAVIAGNCIYESVGGGVRKVELYKRLSGQNVRILRPYAPIESEYNLTLRAESRVGKTKYDVISLIFFHPIHILFGVWLGRRGKKAERAMVCSEFVAWVYGWQYWYKTDNEDFENSDKFTIAYESERF